MGFHDLSYFFGTSLEVWAFLAVVWREMLELPETKGLLLGHWLGRGLFFGGTRHAQDPVEEAQTGLEGTNLVFGPLYLGNDF